ncbi:MULTISPECIES: hypothetical protein [unclassified Synechococcus]|uniref:hypothetical protein n=1 Tax=unclassified Synechococcus TaxID=2626047 RepID=UPI0020CF8A15|nr:MULTISPECIES: hypothetical protein [unclassified Synechococcus]MCP9857270.1 hypothetical protein [Synechococcus sp. Cruz-9C9]MCP9871785.1 hypothetical protein [Synechococcus sp. Cruz-7B9]
MSGNPGLAYQAKSNLSLPITSFSNPKESLSHQANSNNTSNQDLSFTIAQQIQRNASGQRIKPNGCTYDLRGRGPIAGDKGSVELINKAGYTVEYGFAYFPASPKQIALPGGATIPVPESSSGQLVGANAMWSRKTFSIPEETAKHVNLTVRPVGRKEPVIKLSFNPCDRVCLYTHGTIFNPSFTRTDAIYANKMDALGRNSRGYHCE